MTRAGILAVVLVASPAAWADKREVDFPHWIDVTELVLPDTRWQWNGAFRGSRLVLAWPAPLALKGLHLRGPDDHGLAVLPMFVAEPQVAFGDGADYRAVGALRAMVVRPKKPVSAVVEAIGVYGTDGAGPGFGVGIGLSGVLSLVYRHSWVGGEQRQDLSLDMHLFSLPTSRYVNEIERAHKKFQSDEPRERERVYGHRRGDLPEEVLDCPPDPPPPIAESQVCGNGKIEVAYRQIPAPCIPGRCCASGWAPVQVETCDGTDFGGRTCRSLGFLGGEIACTAACAVDTSGCESTARSGPGALAQLVTSADAVPGAHSAMALNGGVLGVGSTDPGVLRFRLFDAATLAPRGPASEWHLVGMPRAGSLGPLFVAPAGDGFVVAVLRFGNVRSTQTFRVTAAGTIEGPVSTVAGALPLFLAAGDGEAMLGIERLETGWPLDVAKVGHDGKVGPALRAIEPGRTQGERRAGAAYSGGEWIVAGGAAADQGSLPIHIARLSRDGRLLSRMSLGRDGHSPAVVPDSSGRAFVSYLDSDGVHAVELFASHASEPTTMAAGPSGRVLAVEARSGAMTLWTSSQSGVIHRIRALPPYGPPEAAEVLAMPDLQAGSATLKDGAAYLLLTSQGAAAGQPGAPTLYLAR